MNLHKELKTAKEVFGEEPDLSQDEAIDDMDAIVTYHHQAGYIKGLEIAEPLVSHLRAALAQLMEWEGVDSGPPGTAADDDGEAREKEVWQDAQDALDSTS